MSRTEQRKPVDVPATTSYKTVTKLTCDGCGKEISLDITAAPDEEANELAVLLNVDWCVSMLRRRDYCNDCLLPIWEAINKLIKADPDQEGVDPPQEEWEIVR